MRCRLCMAHCKNNPVPLFENGHDTEWNKLISKYLFIEVKQNDCFSTRICVDCMQHLENFHSYHCLVQEKQKLIFNQISTNVTIKNEPPDELNVFHENFPYESAVHEPAQVESFSNISANSSSNKNRYNKAARRFQNNHNPSLGNFENVQVSVKNEMFSDEEDLQSIEDQNFNIVNEMTPVPYCEPAEKFANNLTFYSEDSANGKVPVKNEMFSDDEEEIESLENQTFMTSNAKNHKNFQNETYQRHSSNSLSCRICGNVAESFEDAKIHLNTQHNVAFKTLCSTNNKSNENNLNALLNAIKDVLFKNKGYKSTAKVFGVHVSLLKRHSKKLKTEFKDMLTNLTDEILLEYLRRNTRLQAQGKSNTTKTRRSMKSPDYSIMLKAVKDVLIEKAGIRPTARKYGADKSMLSRYAKKVSTMFENIQCVPDEDILNAIYQCHRYAQPNMDVYIICCGLRFYTQKPYDDHRNSPPSTFRCDVCDKQLLSAKTLYFHKMAKHTDRQEYRYVCQICGQRFMFSCMLKKHIPTHSSAKPFKCDICGNSYASSSYLRSHKRQHLKNSLRTKQVYDCELCQKEFSCEENFHVHLTLTENQKCFRSKAKPIEREVTFHYKVENKCCVCNKIFKKKNILQKHLEVHIRKNKLARFLLA